MGNSFLEKWELGVNSRQTFCVFFLSTTVGLNSLLCKHQIILDVAQASDLHKNIDAVKIIIAKLQEPRNENYVFFENKCFRVPLLVLQMP